MYYASACLRRLRSGKYCGVLKYKDDGEWKQTTRTLKATAQRAAKKELEEWRAEMEGVAVAEARAKEGPQGVYKTIDAYLESKRGEVEASTESGYRYTAEKVIKAFLPDMPLTDLTTEAVRTWQRRAFAHYSPVVCNKGLTLLRSVMNDAVNLGLIQRDPTRGVKPKKKGPTTHNTLDRHEMQRVVSIIEACGDEPALLAAEMALLTGLRRGEVCALRWRDIDLEGGKISVSEAIGRGGSMFYVKDPKTAESARTVWVPETLVKALERRRASVAAQFAAAGVPFDASCFVLGDISGNYISPQLVSNRWRAFAEGAGIVGTLGKRPRFHDLRHTWATQAVAANIDIKTVSAALGHANAAMTLNIYADATPRQKQAAAKTMQGVLTGRLGGE